MIVGTHGTIGGSAIAEGAIAESIGWYDATVTLPAPAAAIGSAGAFTVALQSAPTAIQGVAAIASTAALAIDLKLPASAAAAASAIGSLSAALSGPTILGVGAVTAIADLATTEGDSVVAGEATATGVVGQVTLGQTIALPSAVVTGLAGTEAPAVAALGVGAEGHAAVDSAAVTTAVLVLGAIGSGQAGDSLGAVRAVANGVAGVASSGDQAVSLVLSLADTHGQGIVGNLDHQGQISRRARVQVFWMD